MQLLVAWVWLIPQWMVGIRPVPKPSEANMQTLEKVCDVVLMHRLCHRIRHNLLHRRNIYVQIFLHAEIIEFSAGACISISRVVNSKTSLALFLIFCGRPGIPHL
jgi:hypothetical protein